MKYITFILVEPGIYTPSNYILASKVEKYEAMYGRDMGNTFFKQSDREYGIMVLMRINLLKRLESSVYAFRLTIGRVLELIENYRSYTELRSQKVIELQELNEDDFDMDDQNTDFFTVGKRVKIDLVDMDYKSWSNDWNMTVRYSLH